MLGEKRPCIQAIYQKSKEPKMKYGSLIKATQSSIQVGTWWLHQNKLKTRGYYSSTQCHSRPGGLPEFGFWTAILAKGSGIFHGTICG